MANNKSKSTTSRNTGVRNGRPAPMVNKAGVTNSGRRSYGCGGKAKSK